MSDEDSDKRYRKVKWWHVSVPGSPLYIEDKFKAPCPVLTSTTTLPPHQTSQQPAQHPTPNPHSSKPLAKSTNSQPTPKTKKEKKKEKMHLLALLPIFIALTHALPDIFLGTVDTCSPSRYPTAYAAWLASSAPCTSKNNNGTLDSALTLIGNYPISNAGCDLGAFTVGGHDNITFTGCLGPPGPYPTAVLRNGKKKLECAPLRRAKEDGFCESDLCRSQGRVGGGGVLKTVLRCRRTENCD